MLKHIGFALCALTLATVPVFAQEAGDEAAAATAQQVAGSVLAGASEVETTIAQVPGSAAAVVNTIQASATIQAIDAATRDITLLTQDGRTETLTAGPAVRNFDQLAVGDQVNVTYQEAIAVFLGQEAAPSAEIAAGVVRAPVGGTPGGALMGQGQITAKVLELDKVARQAKLQLPGDDIRDIQIRDDVDLSQVEVGDTVTVAISKALAIDVAKPQ